MRRPCKIVDLAEPQLDPVEEVVSWLEQTRPRVLNVAGPRESGAPGIREQTTQILSEALVRAGLV